MPKLRAKSGYKGFPANDKLNLQVNTGSSHHKLIGIRVLGGKVVGQQIELSYWYDVRVSPACVTVGEEPSLILVNPGRS